jgi:hypothetical protein
MKSDGTLIVYFILEIDLSKTPSIKISPQQ